MSACGFRTMVITIMEWVRVPIASQAEKFICRFLIHTLPAGFQRIRSFGFLANRHRHANLELYRRLLAHPVTDLLPHPAVWYVSVFRRPILAVAPPGLLMSE
jgi:hypothetical protein